MTNFKEAFEKAEKISVVEKSTAKQKEKDGSNGNGDLVLRVPPMKKVPTTAGKREAIDKAVEATREYVANITEHMIDLVSRISEIKTASIEERDIRGGELAALEDEVLAHILSEEKALASVARQAYAMALVLTLPADKRAVIAAINGGGKNSRLPGLLQLGILSQTDADAKGTTVAVYGDRYKVNGKREFAAEVAKILANKSLKAKANISIIEMFDGKSGKIFVDVPDAVDGQKFLAGGALLAESDGRIVRVAAATGHFSKIVAEIMAAKTFIYLKSLKKERFWAGERLSDDAFRLCRILHSVLRRGIAEVR
ncbi:hypothetical protein HY838_01005 [Candidatus Azambacteria bacterium]|nr:hypothetical protein [Candidatus Azambacteria bacterium]